jgi:hypothetical protein
MNGIVEVQFKATKLVHWPTGLTYACDHHSQALQKIASAMRIHIAAEDYFGDDRHCTNCLNENSIAKGDSGE